MGVPIERAKEIVVPAGPARQPLVRATPEGRSYLCAQCGYGIHAREPLPTCPMCRATSWPRKER